MCVNVYKLEDREKGQKILSSSKLFFYIPLLSKNNCVAAIDIRIENERKKLPFNWTKKMCSVFILIDRKYLRRFGDLIL